MTRVNEGGRQPFGGLDVRAAAREIDPATVCREAADMAADWMEEEARDNFPPRLHALVVRPPAFEIERMLVVLDGPFNEPGDKRALLGKAGRSVYEQRIVPLCVVLCCEAWLSQSREHSLPADDPARQEVIVLASSTLDRRTAMGRLPTVRVGDELRVGGEFAPHVGECSFPLLNAFWYGWGEKAFAKLAKQN